MIFKGKILRHLPILALLVTIALVYYPGLHGPFVLDDDENIILNQSVAVNHLDLHTLHDAIWGNDSGPFKRPLAALSFALNYYFAGGFESSFWFKLTNLGLHLVNTVLIYLLALALLRSPVLVEKLTARDARFIAIVSTALWALHPIQLTNVLYVVQRMNSMSAMFVIGGLILFSHGRERLRTDDRKGILAMFAGTLIAMVLGGASKENAVLMPLYALTIEYCFYRRASLSRKTRDRLFLFYSISLLIPLILFVIYIVSHPDFLHDQYLGRNFTLTERLMTEARVLWFYVGLILIPNIHKFGLFHGDIPLSTSLFMPLSTLPSILGIAGLAGFAFVRAKKYPVMVFAILWFLLGHSLESSVFGLEIAFEHRNYLPSFGIFLAVSYSLNRLLMTKENLRKIIWITLPILVLMIAFITWNRANIWGDTYSLAEENVRNHPDSPRANDMAARASLGKGDFNKSIGYFLNGARAAPDEAGFLIDIRIVLAGLASTITDRVKHATNGLDAGRIDIKGLPDDIIATQVNGVIHLTPRDRTKNLIEDLLQTRAISSHGITSLDTLHDCILNPPNTCAPLYDEAMSWFTAAATNRNTSPEYRALILADTASLYAWKNNYKKALEYIGPAIKTDPNRIFYQLLEADYLIHVQRLDEAKIALDRIERDNARNRFGSPSHLSMYIGLRKQLEISKTHAQ
ncbi:MAG: tetratricopeptide repeat protein [Sulfuricaulis sp.]